MRCEGRFQAHTLEVGGVETSFHVPCYPPLPVSVPLTAFEPRPSSSPCRDRLPLPFSCFSQPSRIPLRSGVHTDKTGVMVLSWTPLRVADGAKAKGRWRPRLKHNLGVIMFLYTSRLPSLPPQPQALRGSTNPNAAGEEGWLVLASPREDASVQFRLPCLPDPRVRAARPNCMRSCSCMSGNGPLPRCYHGCDRTCNEGRPSPPVGPSPCLPRTSLLDPPPVYHGQL
jgi:hypothetical protein